MSLPPAETIRERTRSLSLSVVLWLFGLSTTVLLIGLWGRSVAVDEVTLEASAHAVLESELVNDRMTEWIGEAMAVASKRAPDEIAGAVAQVTSSRAFSGVLDDLVDQSVTAALAPPGVAVTVDLADSIEALVPVVSDALADHGVAVDQDAVHAGVAGVQDVVLETPRDPSGASGAARSASQVLTWVFVIGLAGLIASGASAMVLARDRISQARSLGVRLAVSAVTFAIILRIGAWAVDPRGGRSPIRAGGSVLLSSNGHIPVLVALVAGGVIVTASWVLVRRRRRPAPADPGEPQAAVSVEDPEAVTGVVAAPS